MAALGFSGSYERVAAVPAHRQQDDLARKPVSLERVGRDIAHSSAWGNDVSDNSMVNATDPDLLHAGPSLIARFCGLG